MYWQFYLSLLLSTLRLGQLCKAKGWDPNISSLTLYSVCERMTSHATDVRLSCISPHSGVCILVSHLQSSRRHKHLIYPANGAERRRCYQERAR